MIPKVKTWLLTVERGGKLITVMIEAPNKRLAVLNYRLDVSLTDGILSVSRKSVGGR